MSDDEAVAVELDLENREDVDHLLDMLNSARRQVVGGDLLKASLQVSDEDGATYMAIDLVWRDGR